MSPRRAALLLLVAAGLLLTLGVVRAQNPYKLKPEARGGACLECHVDFQETMARPHVHSPVKAGDCSDCHNPHASTHGKLLATDPGAICLECHDDSGAGSAHSAHPAVVEGDCVACHDPHASDHPNQLHARGEELCFACHSDVSDRVASNRFDHAPVKDDCLTCHDPHASAEFPALLTRGEPALCVECHDPNGKAFSEQHLGYPVGEARCTSCHAAHGSDVGGILLGNIHEPIRNKMCRQCHGDAESADPLALGAEGLELCRGCHADTVNDVMLARRVHWPVVDDRSCLNCHAAHASTEDGLLQEPMKLLCGNCHGDVIEGDAASPGSHAPVEEGSCTACHSPHASEHEFLLAADSGMELCGTCHDWQAHSSHPIGAEAVDQRNPNLTLDCNSCHRSHGAPHEKIAHFETRRELCVQCHENFRR